MDNEIFLEPRAEVLIESMRSIGYTFESAMADIIDNSISAKAKKIDIRFDPFKGYISFLDDGCGMDFDELMEAMRWGSKDPLKARDKDDLGRFGLGMKSASLSQCRKLTVVSKKGNSVNGLIWDLDHVRKVNSWSVLPLSSASLDIATEIAELEFLDSGTLVIWENFDKIEVESNDLITTIEEKLEYAYDYLSLVFHQFINEGKVTISINENELQNIDPFLTKSSYTQQLMPEDLKVIDKEKSYIVRVQPYVLPHASSLSQTQRQELESNKALKGKQGFYIYRNKRLIIWGTWFRLTAQNELFKNARVKVEIPNAMDEIWSIDVKKSQASIPASLKKQLFHAVNQSIAKSEKIYTHRAVNQNTQKGYQIIWTSIKDRNKVIYKINRDLPLLAKITENMSENELQLMDLFLTDIENNLPKYDIYTTVSKCDDVGQEEKAEVVERLKKICNTLGDLDEVKLTFTLASVLKSEPYCNYGDLEEIIKEWIKNGRTN